MTRWLILQKACVTCYRCSAAHGRAVSSGCSPSQGAFYAFPPGAGSAIGRGRCSGQRRVVPCLRAVSRAPRYSGPETGFGVLQVGYLTAFSGPGRSPEWLVCNSGPGMTSVCPAHNTGAETPRRFGLARFRSASPGISVSLPRGLRCFQFPVASDAYARRPVAGRAPASYHSGIRRIKGRLRLPRLIMAAAPGVDFPRQGVGRTSSS